MYLAEADTLANRLGLRNVALRLMSGYGLRLLQAGQFDASIRAYREVVAAAEDAGAVQQRVSALRFMSYSLQLQHRYEEMARVPDQALELSESSGERWNRAELLGLRGRAAAATRARVRRSVRREFLHFFWSGWQSRQVVSHSPNQRGAISLFRRRQIFLFQPVENEAIN